MSRTFQIILTVVTLSFVGFVVKSYAGVNQTRSIAPLTQADRSSLAPEASDGDGETPDAMEASEQASRQETSDRTKSRAGSSDLAQSESAVSGDNHAEVSDGDGEIPDALEHH